MAVVSAIKPEFVTVRYFDPQDGSVTRTMYSNNIPTICATVNPDSTCIWKACPFRSLNVNQLKAQWNGFELKRRSSGVNELSSRLKEANDTKLVTTRKGLTFPLIER